MKKIFLLLATALFATGSFAAGDVWVNGYTRSDGTQVQGHYRSSPDYTPQNNWSARGNVNPHTGEVGTKDYNYNINPSYRSNSSSSSYNSHRSNNSNNSNSLYQNQNQYQSPYSDSHESRNNNSGLYRFK